MNATWAAADIGLFGFSRKGKEIHFSLPVFLLFICLNLLTLFCQTSARLQVK